MKNKAVSCRKQIARQHS